MDAARLPFAIVGALSVAGSARTVGLSYRGATAAGCLFLLAPIVQSQTTAGYTDLIFIALFLAAFHFLLRFLTELHHIVAGAVVRSAGAASLLASTEGHPERIPPHRLP